MYYHLKSENSKMEKEANWKEIRATFFKPWRMWSEKKNKNKNKTTCAVDESFLVLHTS